MMLLKNIISFLNRYSIGTNSSIRKLPIECDWTIEDAMNLWFGKKQATQKRNREE